MVKFGIHRVEIREGEMVVDGRCFEEPVKIGTVFQRLYRTDLNDNVIERKTINLLVENIVAYGRELELVEKGLTARIVLRGDRIEENVESDTWVLTN